MASGAKPGHTLPDEPMTRETARPASASALSFRGRTDAPCAAIDTTAVSAAEGPGSVLPQPAVPARRLAIDPMATEIRAACANRGPGRPTDTLPQGSSRDPKESSAAERFTAQVAIECREDRTLAAKRVNIS